MKVTDFGLGQVQAAVAQSMLLSGSLVNSDGLSVSGTVEYMSPQQKAGEQPDARDDLYAAGIIACELLTGSRPGPLGIAKVIQRSGLDARFASFLEKALEQERADRYANAAEMAEALTALDQPAAHPAQLPPASPPERVALDKTIKSSAAPLWNWLASAATALVLVGGLVFAIVFFSHRQPVKAERVTLATGQPGLRLDFGGGVAMDFARIEPGTFTMGSPLDEPGRGKDEAQHTVTIGRPFYMSTTEVTQAQWKAVMGTSLAEQQAKASKKLPLPGESAASPMYYVSWDDATEFCRRLSEKTGRKLRLPTEAEWEYACRAGTSLPYGIKGKLMDVGWHHDNSQSSTHPAAQKQPNAWGLYDMHGNVSEWCADWYWDYPTAKVRDPQGAETALTRVVRGGAWSSSLRNCRSAYRLAAAPSRRADDIGFRCVQESNESLPVVQLDRIRRQLDVPLTLPSRQSSPGAPHATTGG